MVLKRKVKVLIAKLGLDGHDRGAKVLSALLRDGGFEVLYLGLYNTPEIVVQSALQEDVDVIGISFLSGEHLTLTPKVRKRMEEKGLGHILLIVGGIIPKEDIATLKKMGVAEVFAGSLAQEAIDYLKRQFPDEAGS